MIKIKQVKEFCNVKQQFMCRSTVVPCSSKQTDKSKQKGLRSFIIGIVGGIISGYHSDEQYVYVSDVLSNTNLAAPSHK